MDMPHEYSFPQVAAAIEAGIDTDIGDWSVCVEKKLSGPVNPVFDNVINGSNSECITPDKLI